ncbi:hypothetical protein BCR35DRAFT_334421 [Leucosporidium creatinivorum]|uniref:Uncharacterized protein n=1 Tax=Leucosporidium creatinivorum TaxID=106004 RepID=A0A1Y2E9H2_9BASI|nr:hypothetical protein BCR35DRAFT_334421 [Leucosporidium creatinivorum]
MASTCPAWVGCSAACRGLFEIDLTTCSGHSGGSHRRFWSHRRRALGTADTGNPYQRHRSCSPFPSPARPLQGSGSLVCLSVLSSPSAVSLRDGIAITSSCRSTLGAFLFGSSCFTSASKHPQQDSHARACTIYATTFL